MNTFRFPTRIAAASLMAVLLTACQTTPQQHGVTHGSQEQGRIAASPILRQDIFQGAYEVAVGPDAASIFVASTPSFEAGNTGFLHRLSARALQPLQTIQLPKAAFALGFNAKTNTVFVGHTLDGALSLVDADSGIIKGWSQLAQPVTDADGKVTYDHTRKVLVDEAHNRVFVTSPGREGKVWIVDGATGAVLHTVETGEPWTAGVAYDSAANRLYVSQGGIHEILAIDPDAGQIVQRYSTGDTTDRNDSKHFLINLAFDAEGQRLLAADADTSQVYVFDAKSGKVLHTAPVDGPGLLDIVYNAKRNEFYTTNRGVSRQKPDGSGAVTVFDAGTYQIKQVIALSVHPNSLAITPDGNSLYVTVKAPHGDKHPAARKNGRDSVVRIDLP